MRAITVSRYRTQYPYPERITDYGLWPKAGTTKSATYRVVFFVVTTLLTLYPV